MKRRLLVILTLLSPAWQTRRQDWDCEECFLDVYSQWSLFKILTA